FLLSIHRPPTSPLFPYTTLFRSVFVSQNFHHPPARTLAARRPLHNFHLHHHVLQVIPIAALCAFAQHPVRRSLNRVVGETLSVLDRKSTRLNSSHSQISYAVFCL